MSSATSTDGTEAELPAPGSGDTAHRDTSDPREPLTSSGSSRARSRDDSLQPWHFFLLLSLVAATVAVVMAREGRPEHLVLISLTIGAAGVRRRRALPDACASRRQEERSRAVP